MKKKKLLTLFIIHGLLTTQVMAQDTSDNIVKGIGITSQILGTVLNAKMQIANQQAAANQLAQMRTMYSPKYGPSTLFPECQLPMSLSNFPQNVCQVSTNPAQVQAMMGTEMFAQQMSNFYAQMANDAAINTTPNGMKCLNDQKKNVEAQITEMVNNLTRMQTQLKKESETFRDQNKNLLSNLEGVHSELYGTSDQGSAKNSANSKTRDFTKSISPACQGVIGKEGMAQARELGLNGLFQSTTAKNKSAGDFNQSRGQIESEIRSSVQKIKDSVNSNGVDNWSASSAQGQSELWGSSYPVLGTMMERERQRFLSQKARIANDINKLDPNFAHPTTENMGNFLSSAPDYFRKKYINDCATNASMGVSIDINVIVNGVQQTGTGNSNASIDGYRRALQNILNNDNMFLSDKLDQIKNLESTYPGMTVPYTGANGGNTMDSPYNLIYKSTAACETKYQETRNTSTAKGMSEKAKAEKIQALLKEEKNLTDNFSGTMSNNIVDAVLNCNGQSMKSTDSCSEGTFDAKSEGFCMAKATSCANSVSNCYSELNAQVETKKASIQNMANLYNANVKNMIERANAFYKGQEQAVTGLVKSIQSRFPGSNFEIPTDMMIAMPEMNKDKFGVDMAANGDINAFIADLPTKIEKLKEMFQKQKEAASQEMGDFISKQKQAMAQEKSRWEKLYSECKGLTDQSTAQMNEQNKQGAEMNKKTFSFCKKYDSLRNNPMPDCTKAKALATTAEEISATLSPSAISYIEDYDSACNGFQNEGTDSAQNIEAQIACAVLQGAAHDICIKKKSQPQATPQSPGVAPIGSVNLDKLCLNKTTTDDELKRNIENMLPATNSGEAVTDAINAALAPAAADTICSKILADSKSRTAVRTALQPFLPQAPAPTKQEKLQGRIRAIGEQNQSTCNSENANSMIVKDPFGLNSLRTFDATIMGTGGRQQ